MTVIGEVIGNYRLVAELGKGGMGVVYVAEHVSLGRIAALKMLLPQFSSDESIVQRFFNEARAASKIDHPGIVEIYDFGVHRDGRAYIVMALLKGETLQQRLQREPMSPIEGATLVAQVAGALAAAHERGIVHRDLKPDNIFLVANELMPFGLQCKLLDFGIAKLNDDRASFKTQTGSLIGTPAYMSPEQCMGRSDLDHRTDLYALGCILFHVLCGRPPFVSEAGAGMMIAAHLRDPAPDPRGFNPHVSAQLAAITLRLLEKDPRARFQTANETREALMTAGANVSLTRPMTAQRASEQRINYGPEAYDPTTYNAPTTASGSAGQMQPTPARRPDMHTWRGTRKGMWAAIAFGVLGVGGIATYLVLGAIEDHPRPAAPPAPAVAESPIPPTPEVACPAGQSRRADTNGQCCWGDQAWSASKHRCVGAPTCPPGMTVKAEECVVAVVVVPTPLPPTPASPPASPPSGSLPPTSPAAPVPASPPPTNPMPVPSTPPSTATTPASPVPKFVLAQAVVETGAPVIIKFAQPVSSRGNHRAWVTLVEPQRPKDAYDIWDFVPDGAKTLTLKAPAKAGTYEARVHTDYSAISYNVRYSVTFQVREKDAVADANADVPVTPLAKQRFSVPSTTLPAKETTTLTFAVPLRAAPGEQFWVTTVKADAADGDYGAYEYVPAKARTMQLAMPATPGEYEIRLHANYPTKSRNLVHRVRVRIVD